MWILRVLSCTSVCATAGPEHQWNRRRNCRCCPLLFVGEGVGGWGRGFASSLWCFVLQSDLCAFLRGLPCSPTPRLAPLALPSNFGGPLPVGVVVRPSYLYRS
ncbi:unnamed protein product [Discosporangium mesarthrocarpum]